MREIMFRAWHKKRRKFYDVLHLHLKTAPSEDIWATCKGRACIEQKDIHIKIESKDMCIVQYTGLKDKHGKEIYEEDIIHHGQHECPGEKNKVVFNGGRWELFVRSGRRGYELYHVLHDSHFFEVIGNTFQHSELLERAKC